MSESEPEKSESSESGHGRSRWCFVIDTAGRIVHTAETPPAAELPRIGCDLESPNRRPTSVPPANIVRPSFDSPWWTITVEDVDRHAAGRTALALVEDDRAASGLPESAFEPAAATATPAPTALGVDVDRFGELDSAAGNVQCCQGPTREGEFSRAVVTITEVPERTRELVRRSEEFARVRTYRGYLNHATEIAAPTEDVRILVEQAEFWQGEFAETYNRSSETIAQLREELDDYRAAEVAELGDEPLAGQGPKECFDVECPEFEEITIEFQEATWEVTFDLNGKFIGLNFGEYLKGEPLDAGAEPIILTPGLGAYSEWFTVAVRSTNSSSAIELAHEALREREGITGDALAVMAGERTVEESGASVQQLGWVRKWAEGQLAATEASAAQFRTYLDRLDQAGAPA